MKPSMMRQVTAYHEAGHAVAAYIHKIHFLYVTIERNNDDSSNGHIRRKNTQQQKRDFELLEQGRVTPTQRERLERYIIYCFAGTVAEEYFTKRNAHISGPDADADNIIRSLSNHYLEEAKAYRHWLWVRTQTFTHNHWPKIEAIAQALLTEQQLTNKRVREVLDQLAPTTA